MKYLKIADINVKAEYINSIFFEERYKQYECPPFEKCDLFLKTLVSNHIEMPKGKLIDRIKSKYIIQDDNYKYICLKAGENIALAVKMNSDYSEVIMSFNKNLSHKYFTLTQQEYLFSGNAFNDRLMFLNGTVMHGSAIAYKNSGIIFSADSGIGKSTHTKLWKEYFKDDVIILNDDKPALKFNKDDIYIYGTPWSGKTDLNTNLKAKLKAIVFIKRAEKNEIKRLERKESIYNIAAQTTRPFYDNELSLKSIEYINKIINKVPIYLMQCNISYEAVHIVKSNIICC